MGIKNCSPCNSGGSISWIRGLRLSLLKSGEAPPDNIACTNASSASRRQHWMTSVTAVKINVSSVVRSMMILRVVEFT